jgi:hypothetical protein
LIEGEEREDGMNIALTVTVSAAMSLLAIVGSTAVRASEIEVYRADHERADCRMVEMRTINRWGDEVTIRQRVCS